MEIIEQIRKYVLSKKFVEECMPFDESTLVYKIGGKMFLLMSLDQEPLRINVKTAPEHSEVLREEYPQITPGYHMNKKHWNSVVIDGYLSMQLIKELIDESFYLVVNKLPMKNRKELGL